MLIDVYTIGFLQPSNPPPCERVLCFQSTGPVFPSWEEAVAGVKAHHEATVGPAGAIQFTAYRSDDGSSGLVEIRIGKGGMATAMGGIIRVDRIKNKRSSLSGTLKRLKA